MYNLTIVTPEELVFEGEVSSLIVPGKEGYMEILTNHAPIISTLKEGKITVITKNQGRLTYFVTGGFLEVSHNNATVLADEIQQQLNS